ncbi:MAG: class I SAM-dependent methyltransferase, partial [Bacilli bacterium]
KDTFKDCDDTFYQSLKFIGDHSSRVLEIGCADGYSLMYTNLYGKKVCFCLGIDTSINAINLAKETIKLSKLENINFELSSNASLDLINDNSFDGIICSNVLDVLPIEVAKGIIINIDRILCPNGYLFLKFNYYVSEELKSRIKGMVNMGENCYSLNGVLRLHNEPIEYWKKLFKDYKVIKETEFERIKDGPLDRILILQKK